MSSLGSPLPVRTSSIHDDYEIRDSVLGYGTFSSVKLCINKNNRQEFALKVLIINCGLYICVCVGRCDHSCKLHFFEGVMTFYMCMCCVHGWVQYNGRPSAIFWPSDAVDQIWSLLYVQYYCYLIFLPFIISFIQSLLKSLPCQSIDLMCICKVEHYTSCLPHYQLWVKVRVFDKAMWHSIGPVCTQNGPQPHGFCSIFLSTMSALWLIHYKLELIGPWIYYWWSSVS